jgi:hypothetical protein
MIYVHNNAKGNVYTKLDDVLEIHKLDDKIPQEGFEKLGNAVNNNYNTFTQKMIDLQSKPVMQPYSKYNF